MRVMQLVGWQILKQLGTLMVLIGMLFLATSASAQSSDSCERPEGLEPGAFDRPMTFTFATTGGNSSHSIWIAATGVIGPETPARFLEFFATEENVPPQIIFYSPGGNLVAGLELGHLIREAGLAAHIGMTERSFESHAASCDTWFDDVEAGICASSCAYAFLGGRARFLSSPYYRTREPNLLGFHQFYGGREQDREMLTPSQIEGIEVSTLSVAQALTGYIVIYAIEMGIDPRIVAVASATTSDDLYYPTPAEIEEWSIASGSGLGERFMEPFNDGLVTAARPRNPNSMLQQITAFCSRGRGEESLLITMAMDLATRSQWNPSELPLQEVRIEIDGVRFAAPRRDLEVRYRGDTIEVTVPVGGVAYRITAAREINFTLTAPQAMGNFYETSRLDATARQSIALAWRNCI